MFFNMKKYIFSSDHYPYFPCSLYSVLSIQSDSQILANSLLLRFLLSTIPSRNPHTFIQLHLPLIWILKHHQRRSRMFFFHSATSFPTGTTSSPDLFKSKCVLLLSSKLMDSPLLPSDLHHAVSKDLETLLTGKIYWRSSCSACTPLLTH